MLWPTCGVVGLTFNETEARQDSRKGEQQRRLVEAIAVCRILLAQVPLASCSWPRDGASDAGRRVAVLAGLSLCRAGAILGHFSRWAAVKPSVTSAVLSVPTAVFTSVPRLSRLSSTAQYPPLAFEFFRCCRDGDGHGGMPLLARRDKHCPLGCLTGLYR
jgi:hypothetical protein